MLPLRGMCVPSAFLSFFLVINCFTLLEEAIRRTSDLKKGSKVEFYSRPKDGLLKKESYVSNSDSQMLVCIRMN